MYHIKSDKRSLKSAQIITDGLMACLNEKPLTMITITDLAQKAYISRSTFYRLFDNIEDILVYMLESTFRDLAVSLEKGSTGNIYTQAIELCYENADLIKIIFQANRYDLLFLTYEKIMNGYVSGIEPVSEQKREQIYYNFAIMAGLLIGTLHAWVKEGQKESLLDLCSKAGNSLKQLQERSML